MNAICERPRMRRPAFDDEPDLDIRHDEQHLRARVERLERTLRLLAAVLAFGGVVGFLWAGRAAGWW